MNAMICNAINSLNDCSKNINVFSGALRSYMDSLKSLIIKNHLVDLERASGILLNDYRQGALGRISLESPKSRELLIEKNKRNREKIAKNKQ